MNTYYHNTNNVKVNSGANGFGRKRIDRQQLFQLKADSPAAITNKQYKVMANNSPQAKQLRVIQQMVNTGSGVLQLKAVPALADQHLSVTVPQKQIENTKKQQGKFVPAQKKEDKTGLPGDLESGVENLSGFSLDGVKVHYNSENPAQLNALAFAQGTEIHIASGQEKHLPHEAWHVVQQKQGRVRPTVQLKGRLNVIDDESIENGAYVGPRQFNKYYTVNNNQSVLNGLNDSKKPAIIKHEPGPGQVIQRAINILPAPNDPEPSQRLTPGQAEHIIAGQFPQADMHLVRARLQAYLITEGYWRTLAQFVAFIRSQIQQQSQLETAAIQQYFPGANDQVIGVGRLAAQAGVTVENLQWANQHKQNNKDLYFILGAMQLEQARTGNVNFVKVIFQRNIHNEGLYKLVQTSTDICPAKLNQQSLDIVFNRYLNGQNTCDRVNSILIAFNDFSAGECTSILQMSAAWPAVAIQFNNLLSIAHQVPDHAIAISALGHCHFMYDQSQTLLDMLVHAVNVPFGILQWIASINCPSGNTPLIRAHCGLFITSYQQINYIELAKWIVADIPLVAQAGIAIHNYVTDNGQIVAADILQQRFIAIRAARGHIGNAQNALAVHFNIQDAINLLANSGSEHNHVADNRNAAYDKAKFRGAGGALLGVTGNSCIMSGRNGMAVQLYRVMEHFRAEIALLQNGLDTRLMTLAVSVNENLWYRFGQPGTEPAEVRWATLEVVIGKQVNGSLFLRHAQPNS